MLVRCGVKMRKNSILPSLPFSESASGLWTSQVLCSIVIFIFMNGVGLLEGARIEYFLSLTWKVQFSSVQFSHSVVSDSLQPQGLQHARLSCPSPTPGACSNSCPLSRWCHPTISSSVVPFSSCPQSFPSSGSFQMTQPFAWGGQSIGVSVSASVLPMNTQTDLL